MGSGRFVADANRYVAEEAPWDLAKAATSHDCGVASSNAAKLHGTLFSLSASLLTIAKCIAPLLPETSQRLFQKLSETASPCDRALEGRRIEVGMPLFPKL
jgi:methionyl-tRNA synthetase